MRVGKHHAVRVHYDGTTKVLFKKSNLILATKYNGQVAVAL